ncbi:MAG TPA: hypothetical protein VNS55_14425 [Nocardioides sp.]|nr:hypothetical protein [Nocardioides sp.]
MADLGTITEPVPRALQRVLRRAVLELALGERRREHPPVLNVGLPERDPRRFRAEPDEALDHALRVDVVQAMLRRSLERSVVPLIWLTRMEGEDWECDVAWGAAVRAAGAELGVSLGLVVVTRHGWHDPRSGVGRTWKRIRARS